MNNSELKKYWEDYEPDIRRICKIKLRSCPNEVDDVIQEVFLAFCKKVKTDGIPEKPKAWIYGTFRNILNLKYREIYKRQEHERSLTDKDYELPYEYDFTEMIIMKESVDEINGIINEVTTDSDKKLLKCIYEDNMKMKEAAEILGSTESAVKQKNYRINRRIRKAVMKKYF